MLLLTTIGSEFQRAASANVEGRVARSRTASRRAERVAAIAPWQACDVKCREGTSYMKGVALLNSMHDSQQNIGRHDTSRFNDRF